MRPLRRRFRCCHRGKEMSADFDENHRVMTYNGLEACMLGAPYDPCPAAADTESAATTTTSSSGAGDDGCCVTTTGTDFSHDEVSSCSSSSKDECGSLASSSSHWLLSGSKREDDRGLLLDDGSPDVNRSDSSNCLMLLKGKMAAAAATADGGVQNELMPPLPPAYTIRCVDVDTMKEKFARLLLGEDVTGGCRGLSTALALSHGITNLAASVFGELWKLEPLSDEKKDRWRREMDWLLSPTNYMVELVPAKQNGANGCTLEIMTPKARTDVHMLLPALRKLDSMLIDVLDSMVGTEFWYAEGGSRAEGRGGRSTVGGEIIRPSKRWWLPCPRVPDSGLSANQRKMLGFQGKIVHQVLKAAKSINDGIMYQMPIPDAVKDALPKSGKASLGDHIYRAVSSELVSVEEILGLLNLKSEHTVLDTVNSLEGAIFAWKQKLAMGVTKKSPVRNSLAFMWDHGSELDRVEYALERAESLLQLLKHKFPNLPQTFIEVTKVQYNKDVGYSIMEAYSRVLGSLAFSILARIGDILQEDDLNKPTTPVSSLKFDYCSDVFLAGVTETPPGHIKRSLVEQMNAIDGRIPNPTKCSEDKFPQRKPKMISPPGISAGMSPHRSLLLW